MVRKLALAIQLIALLVVGCATTEPVVRIQRVEVPVPVVRDAPENLMSCAANLPVPRFIQPSDAAARVALDHDNLMKLRKLTARQVQCDTAWRAWAHGPRP